MNSSVHVEELYKLDKQSPEIELNNYVINNDLQHAVEIEKVNFRYFNSDENLFTDLNINFKKGAHTIITGPNGSGKSTILGLISGLLYLRPGKLAFQQIRLDT